MPSWDQVSGVADRLILVVLTFAVGKGWISAQELTGYATLFVGVVGAFWGFYVNRAKALVQAAAAVPGTTIVTTKAMADSTSEKNIVSMTSNKVVPQ